MPMYLLFRFTILMGSRYCLQVDSSCRHIWIGELHAHRRGQAEAHRAEAAGIDPAARLVELVELRRPHLVLADVRSDEGLALGDLVELLQHELRLDDRRL